MSTFTSKTPTGGQMAVRNADAMANRKILAGQPKATQIKTQLIEGGAPVKSVQGMNSRQIGNTNYPTYKRGGPVKKTGLALVHKGEHVLTRKQATRYSRIKKPGRT